MPSYTIASSITPPAEMRRDYLLAKKHFQFTDCETLDSIFEIALMHPDRFPSFSFSEKPTIQIYLERWIKSYCDAMHNLPSKRIANPKSSCSDPAIKTIVQFTQHISDSEAVLAEANHNLFMSAENIQGNLLEQYIAIKSAPYGILWCNGNILRAIDFCNSDGSFFLQIKNKSNTENSSSSNIREGTSIKKWYRLGTRTQGGRKIPDFKWDILNQLINKYKTSTQSLPFPSLNENDYQLFLSKVALSNEKIITSL